MSELVLTPGQVTLAELERIWREGLAVRLADSARKGIVESAARIDAAANGDVPVYGVNTGFGKLASIKIKTEDTATLQRNLILSHCCGVGRTCRAGNRASDHGAEAAVAGPRRVRHAP